MWFFPVCSSKFVEAGVWDGVVSRELREDSSDIDSEGVAWPLTVDGAPCFQNSVEDSRSMKCQILLSTLTGHGSPICIPRFAFADMSTEQATKLFATHDSFIKNLKSTALYTFLTNLDTVRIEHFPNGSTLKRTTREWASSINTEDGLPAQCDVVNGGLDQKAHFLYPAQNETIALRALEEYRKRLNPFKEREARFRATIGPPLTITDFYQKL